MANVDERFARIGKLGLRGATNTPHRARFADTGELQREVHSYRALGRDGNAAFGFVFSGDGSIQFELHFRFDGLVGLIINHRLANELIAHSTEARQSGLHH